MLKIYVICVVLILSGKILRSFAEEDDSISQTLPDCLCDNKNLKKLTQEINNLKVTIDQLYTLVNSTQAAKNLEKNEINNESCSSNRYEQLVLDELKRIGSKINTSSDSANYGQYTKKQLPGGGELKNFPSNCAEALLNSRISGIYTIQTRMFGPEPFKVYCNAELQGGNWTVFQRRQDGSVNFTRKWAGYKRGFGDLRGEFFMGLEKLHALTVDSPQELLIQLEDFENQTRHAKYDKFRIGWEDEDYPLSALGNYSGDAGDSLGYHSKRKFTTIDRDHDEWEPGNCARLKHGGWWYGSCCSSNLNGHYFRGAGAPIDEGVTWDKFRGYYYSLKRVEMMIRPKVD